MTEAADFAFRQALALDPTSPEAVFRCVSHLLGTTRPKEALVVAETASKLAPQNSQLQSLAQQLTRHLAKKCGAGQS